MSWLSLLFVFEVGIEFDKAPLAYAAYRYVLTLKIYLTLTYLFTPERTLFLQSNLVRLKNFKLPPDLRIFTSNQLQALLNLHLNEDKIQEETNLRYNEIPRYSCCCPENCGVVPEFKLYHREQQIKHRFYANTVDRFMDYRIIADSWCPGHSRRLLKLTWYHSFATH